MGEGTIGDWGDEGVESSLLEAEDADSLSFFAALDAAAAEDALGGIADDARSELIDVSFGLGAFEGTWASADGSRPCPYASALTTPITAVPESGPPTVATR